MSNGHEQVVLTDGDQEHECEHEHFHIGEILWIAGIGFTVFLIFPALLGYLSSAFVTAVATTVLVLVTIYYAWQTRESTKLTQDSLEETQKDRAKPGKVLAIAFGIDPILDDLRANKRRLESEEENGSPLYSLNRWEKPDWAVISDIEASSSYSDFLTDIEEYTDEIREYQEVWIDLKDEMSSELLDGFGDELETIAEDRANPPQKEADLYINDALSYTGMCLEPEDANEKLNQEAMKIRESEDFENELESLESLNEELRTLNLRIGEGLENVRSEYKKEYGIAEHEIKMTSETSELDEGIPSSTPRPAYTE